MDCAVSLAAEKGYEEEYALYSLVARLAPEIIAKTTKFIEGGKTGPTVAVAAVIAQENSSS